MAHAGRKMSGLSAAFQVLIKPEISSAFRRASDAR
jgi:hypothetical protein